MQLTAGGAESAYGPVLFSREHCFIFNQILQTLDANSMKIAFHYMHCLCFWFVASKRDSLSGTANNRSQQTIFVAPPYMTLSQEITQVRFQCYINGQPARDGQTLWMRDEFSVPCNKSNRVFACGNIIIITKVS